MTKRKGIILAGGSGTRLYPLTIGVSKQLLPVYDKPMIYYPLTVLMLSGIQEILIISTPDDLPQYKRVLDDGSQWGITLSFKEQLSPDGLAQAFILAEEFLAGAPSALILGDNIFFGHGLPEVLAAADAKQTGATVFGYHVNDPERYGVLGFDDAGKVNSIVEKPEPASNYAVTGLYFVDGTASERAKKVKPSAQASLKSHHLWRATSKITSQSKKWDGFAWLDTGTHGSLLDAGNFVRTITERQGLQVGSPDEVALRFGWINLTDLKKTARKFGKNAYGKYLEAVAKSLS